VVVGTPTTTTILVTAPSAAVGNYNIAVTTVGGTVVSNDVFGLQA